MGGEQLHEWAFKLAAWRAPHGLEGGEENASTAVVEGSRRTSAPGSWAAACSAAARPLGGGPLERLVGDDPPFHMPVFVLTHHEREPLDLQGDTTFHFVTDGVESALAQAGAAGEEVTSLLGGGAEAVQQYLAAGLVDEMLLNVAPVLLGSGERLFENVGDADGLEQVEAIAAPERHPPDLPAAPPSALAAGDDRAEAGPAEFHQPLEDLLAGNLLVLIPPGGERFWHAHLQHFGEHLGGLLGVGEGAQLLRPVGLDESGDRRRRLRVDAVVGGGDVGVAGRVVEEVAPGERVLFGEAEVGVEPARKRASGPSGASCERPRRRRRSARSVWRSSSSTWSAALEGKWS